MGALLEPEELQRLTGYVRPTYQRRWLAAHGIPHSVNARGEVVVWRAVAERTETTENAARPRWERVR